MPLYLITQSEMVEDLAEKTGFPKGEVKHLLHALEEYTATEVVKGNRVKIAGVVIAPALKKATKSRMGRNPQTGEPVKIKAKPATVKLKARIVAPLSKVKLPSAKKFETF
jgi:nucleoid DNA-binding protein